MTERETAVAAITDAGRGVKARMRRAIEDILALVRDARSDKFAFADNEDIDAEVNAILALMSDDLLADAEKRARNLLKALDLDEWDDESIDYANDEIDGENTLFRLDMQASHLKELLESWIIVAAVHGLSKSETIRNLFTYIANPFASELWRSAGLQNPAWGRGYARNLVKAISRIRADFINRAYLWAKLQQFAEEGAIGYTIHRGSTFDCPLCDSYLGKVYPLDQVILPIHANCCCYVEPAFRDFEL